VIEELPIIELYRSIKERIKWKILMDFCWGCQSRSDFGRQIYFGKFDLSNWCRWISVCDSSQCIGTNPNVPIRSALVDREASKNVKASSTKVSVQKIKRIFMAI